MISPLTVYSPHIYLLICYDCEPPVLYQYVINIDATQHMEYGDKFDSTDSFIVFQNTTMQVYGTWIKRY